MAEAPALDKLDAETLLGLLRRMAARIAEQETVLADLYSERTQVFCALRDLDPPVTQRVIAEAAGVSDVAVIAAIRKAKARAAS